MIEVNATNAADVAKIAAALAAPFEPTEVKFKPQAVKGNRALAMAYVDARVIQDRLDDVMGVTGWQDDYQILPDGSVMCKLTLQLGGRPVSKMDVGGTSEQPDAGDRMKAAVSDALKRTAVKFGVGRYLYRLPAQWADYDPAKRQFVRTPTLPDSAIPKNAKRTPPDTASASASAPKSSSAMPTTGAELEKRLRERDAELAARKVIAAGRLVQHVIRSGEAKGYPRNIAEWSGPAIPFAVQAVKEFQASLKHPRAAQPAGASA